MTFIRCPEFRENQLLKQQAVDFDEKFSLDIIKAIML